MPSRVTLPLHGQGLDIVKGLLTKFVKGLINSNNFEIELKAFWIPSIGTKGDDVVRITPYVVKEGQKWEVYIGEGYTLERPEFVKGGKTVEVKDMRNLFKKTEEKVNTNEYPPILYEFEKKIFGYEENVENNHYLYFIHLKYKNTYLGTTIFKANKKILIKQIKQNKLIYENIVLNFWQVILTELIIPIGNVKQGILYLLPPFYDKFELVSEFPNNATKYADTDLLLIASYCKNKNGSEYQYITKIQWKGLNYQLTFKHSKAPPESDEDKKLLLSALSIFSSLLEREQLLFRIAIISILVDSFAHNIAAHALSVIIEWLRRRVETLTKNYEIKDLKIAEGLKNLIHAQKALVKKNDLNDLKKRIINQEIEDWTDPLKYKNLFNLLGIIRYGNEILRRISILCKAHIPKIGDEVLVLPVSLDDAMYKFLKYLEGKSTFWSGVIRETVLGGLILNWYDLLIEFANNPLFIGTIAATENIYKIEFYMKIDCAQKHFLTVDVSGIKEEKEKMGKIDYAFIKKGSNFDEIKTHLSKMEVFLPGGEGGKQSLYTIFENVLRNIKWCEKEIKREKRINFVIEIEDKGSSCKTYSVNVWLENKTNLFENGEKIINDINEKLKKSIIDDTRRPRLGGLYQNKVCACQLFTNVFDEVENESLIPIEATTSQKCYPWIKVEDNFNGGTGDKGHIIWSFRMWKGEKLGYFDTEIVEGELNRNGLLIQNDKVIDNIRRYKMVVAKDDDKKKEIEALGIVRVVVKDSEIETSNSDKFENYYKKWLNGWLKDIGDKCFCIYLDQGGLKCFSLDKDRWTWTNSGNHERCSQFSHSTKDGYLSYRNHGILIREFMEGTTCKMRDNKQKELSEVMLTKVLIVDDRIFEVVNNYRNNDLLWKELYFKVYPERTSTQRPDGIWEEVKNFLKEQKIHFLVVHLGFMERLSDFKNKEVEEFVKNNIDFGDSSGEKIKCRKLVVTTQRGRSEWYKKIKTNREMKRKILFIPPPAITNALSHGIMIKDDFEIKYGLAKLLLGS